MAIIKEIRRDLHGSLPFYYSDFLKAFFLKGSLILTALKPRGLTLSLPPEKGWKETAKGESCVKCTQKVRQ